LQRSRIVEVTIDTELGMDVVDSHDLASPPFLTVRISRVFRA
jgi:hypothetical protein